MVQPFPTSDRSRARYSRNSRDDYNFANGYSNSSSSQASTSYRKRFSRNDDTFRSISRSYYETNEDYDNENDNDLEDDDSITNARYADEEPVEDEEDEEADAEGEEDESELDEVLLSEDVSKWIWDNAYPGNGEATTEAKIASILRKLKDDFMKNRGESPSNRNAYMYSSSSSGKRPQDNGWDESRRSTGGKRARLELERKGVSGLMNGNYSDMGSSSSYSGYGSGMSSSYMNPRFDFSTSATSSNGDESEKMRKELDELKSTKFTLEQRNFKVQTDYNNPFIAHKHLKEQHASTPSLPSTSSSNKSTDATMSSVLRNQFLNPAKTDEDLDSIWSPPSNSNPNPDILLFNEYAKEIGLGGSCDGKVYPIEKAVLKGMIHLLVAYASERIEKKGTAAPYSSVSIPLATVPVPSSSNSSLAVPIIPSTTAPLATTSSLAPSPIPYVSHNPFHTTTSNSMIPTAQPVTRFARSTDRDRSKLGGLSSSDYTNSSLNGITPSNPTSANYHSSPLANSQVINAPIINSSSFDDYSRSKYFLPTAQSETSHNGIAHNQTSSYPPVLTPQQWVPAPLSSPFTSLATGYFTNSHTSTRTVPSAIHGPTAYPPAMMADCPESAAAYALSSISQTPINSTTNTTSTSSGGTIVNGQNVRGTPSVNQQVVLLSNAKKIADEREQKESEAAIAQVAEFEKSEREALRKMSLDQGFSNGNNLMSNVEGIEENEEKRVNRELQEEMIRNEDIEMEEDEARMREEHEDAESESQLAGTDWDGDESSSAVW